MRTVSFSKHGLSAILALFLTFFSSHVLAIGQCPPIQQASSCNILITINPNGSLKFQTDSAIPPYDGVEDAIVGVLNNSGATIFGIKLTGADIFGFDGDGPFAGGDYGGPDVSFALDSADSGTVNFNSGLNTGAFTYFALEGTPSQIKLAKTITVDPGHGTSCAGVNDPGTVGLTDFPASNPPPGKLKEDELAFAVSSALSPRLSQNGYKVVLTKSSASACLGLLERANVANNAKSNVFVSVHFNRPRTILGIPFAGGSFSIYDPVKTDSKTLGEMVATSTGSSVGVGNDSNQPRSGIGVLRVTSSRMTAIIIEVARLSGSSETIVHDIGSIAKAASGIKAGVDQFLNQ